MYLRAPHCCFLLVFFAPLLAHGVDHVSIMRDGQPIHISGKVLVEAQDGGLLVIDSARKLWAITPDEITHHEKDETEFEVFDDEAMAKHLQTELTGRFRIHKTAHYVICYNTSKAYAEWCGALFERLYRAFGTYWKNRGFQLDEPKWPLVALVFGDRQSYTRYAQPELGDAAGSIPGYFSLRSNRVTMYDLTGADRVLTGISSAAQVNRILSRPEAEHTVATIIHEATHQLAFNRGLQTRYADIPLWVSEGLAIYFETPDLRSSKGWRNIGGVNRVRLNEFRRYHQNRPQNSLVTLISDDQRFHSTRTAPDAYAEAWALSYFLIRKHPKEYLQYTKLMAKKKRLLYDSPEERRQQFQEVFGADLERLDREFLRYIRSIR
jgi:hypothetical protein